MNERNLCEMCRRPRPLTYYRPADEYICDECWDTITEFKAEEDIPVSEQANVPGGLMSLDPGTVPGKRPPNFGSKEYTKLPGGDDADSL